MAPLTATKAAQRCYMGEGTMGRRRGEVSRHTRFFSITHNDVLTFL
jgi:hypothetical protein